MTASASYAFDLQGGGGRGYSKHRYSLQWAINVGPMCLDPFERSYSYTAAEPKRRQSGGRSRTNSTVATVNSVEGHAKQPPLLSERLLLKTSKPVELKKRSRRLPLSTLYYRNAAQNTHMKVS